MDLIALRKAADDARLLYQNIGMQNVAGLTGDEQTALTVQYDQARMRWMEAEKAYNEQAFKAHRVGEYQPA